MEKHGVIAKEGSPSATGSPSTLLLGFLRYRKGDESRPPIWRLNHYLRLTSETGTSAVDVDEWYGMKEALVEYGFDAGMSTKTKMLWADLYRYIIGECGLLRLQEARDKGELLELAESLGSLDRPFTIDNEVRSVLWRLRRR